MTARELAAALNALEYDLEVRVPREGGVGSAGVTAVNTGNWGDFMATWLALTPYQTAFEVETEGQK